jgi:hypothetical protein
MAETISHRRASHPQSFAPSAGSGLIGTHIGALLNSADHGRQILLEIDEMLLAEQDRRPAGLSRLDHQDFGEVDQDFP